MYIINECVFVVCHRFSPIGCGSSCLNFFDSEGESNALLIMANAMELSGQCLSMMGGFFAWTFYAFTVPLRCWGERHATALALKTALEVASTQQVACATPQQRDRQRKLLQRCGYDMPRILDVGGCENEKTETPCVVAGWGRGLEFGFGV